MTEKQVYQEVDAVNETVTELDLNKDEVMERYEISSINTLKRWCKTVGVEYSGMFRPEDVAKLDHLAYHVRTLKMSMSEYEAMIGKQSPAVEVNESHGRYSTQTETEQGSEISQIIQSRYGGTIDTLSDSIADNFWTELDRAVLTKILVTAKRQRETPNVVEQALLPRLVGQSDLFLLPPGEVA